MRRQILIVDDNEQLREMLSTLFVAHGFDVLAAPNCDEGLRVAVCHAVDLALVDVDVGGGCGVALCQALRRDHEGLARDFPIWLMTGSYDFDLTRRALAAGARGILRKPFKVTDALARMEQELGACA